MLQAWLHGSASKAKSTTSTTNLPRSAISALSADTAKKSIIVPAPEIPSPIVTKSKVVADVSTTDSSKTTNSLRSLNYLSLELSTIHPSWLSVLANEFKKPYFKQLKSFLDQEANTGKIVYPPANDIYTWAATPFEKTKVVIIGQDPYHNPGQAHGLSFSVRLGVPAPPSLVNIYKELKQEYTDFEAPKHGYLQGWANEGVLLLNAVLTVRRNEPTSHAMKGWEQLTDAVIGELNSRKRNLVFILWGSHAQKKGAKIDKTKHFILKSTHPSPLSAHKGFFGNNHFKAANDYLKSKGVKPVDWTHLPLEETKLPVHVPVIGSDQIIEKTVTGENTVEPIVSEYYNNNNNGHGSGAADIALKESETVAGTKRTREEEELTETAKRINMTK